MEVERLWGYQWHGHRETLSPPVSALLSGLRRRRQGQRAGEGIEARCLHRKEVYGLENNSGRRKEILTVWRGKWMC